MSFQIRFYISQSESPGKESSIQSSWHFWERVTARNKSSINYLPRSIKLAWEHWNQREFSSLWIIHEVLFNITFLSSQTSELYFITYRVLLCVSFYTKITFFFCCFFFPPRFSNEAVINSVIRLSQPLITFLLFSQVNKDRKKWSGVVKAEFFNSSCLIVYFSLWIVWSSATFEICSSAPIRKPLCSLLHDSKTILLLKYKSYLSNPLKSHLLK